MVDSPTYQSTNACFGQVSGPRLVTKRLYIKEMGGEEELRGTVTTELVSSEFSADITEELFRVDLPEGTRVIQ